MAAAPKTSPAESLRQAGVRAWRSPRVFALVLLTVAVVLGAYLRFYRLAADSMDGDEGVTWMTATAPSLRALEKRQQEFDPGKLALYEVLMRGWIEVFGDSLFSMRAMSSASGVISIVLVFAAVREIRDSFGDSLDSDSAESSAGDVTGSFAALIYAANMDMVLSDRWARMYALMMTLALAQILFFARSQRRGGFANYAATAIFTALMIAANFSAGLLLVAEGLWLGCLLIGGWTGARTGGLAVWGPAGALAAGVALLSPMIPGMVSSSAHAIAVGTWSWLKVKTVWWPYTVLRSAANSHKLFRVLMGLGVFGVWWQWRKARMASGFFVAWMAGPILAALAVTYLLHPLEFPRYVLIAFVGMFALAAMGASALRSTLVRIAIAVVLIHLSVHPVRHWLKQSHAVAWNEATARAVARAAPDDKIAVFPSFCADVVRYYTPPQRRKRIVGLWNNCGAAHILIMGGFKVYSASRINKMLTCYPHLIANVHKAEIRSR